MKILFDYCSQAGAYKDSYGKCLVLVEDGDDIKKIKDELCEKKD
jgi:hypothetical protein